jgi:hypothetical protein
VETNSVAQWRKETAGVELHTLPLVEAPGAEEEALEAVGVLLHGARTSALRELEEGRRA